jgi:hypothetical protein
MPGDLHSENYQLKFKNMKRNIVAVGVLLLSATLWSCSDSDSSKTSNETTKEALTTEAKELKTAVEEITVSKGFELITMTETVKEGNEEDDDRFSFERIIALEDIKGIYDYILPEADEESETKMWGWKKAFNRVGDSDSLIINLPQEKATRPWKLHVKEDGDTELDNDFNIAASQYNMSTVLNNDGFEFDYLLDADIKIEEEEAGDIFVDWNISSAMNFEYKSEFGFANDYSVGHMFEFGDTTEFAYNLKKDDEVLYMEEVEYIRGVDGEESEYEYTLTIGNIKIVKNSSSDEYMVYRDGELEEGAVITVLEDDTKEGEEGEGENDESDDAFCRGGFDIKITFADGTEVILSELIGEDTLEDLDEIFGSMHDMYFVKKLVDKVAREAYEMNMQQEGGE